MRRTTELWSATIIGQPIVKKNTQRTGAGGFRYNSPSYQKWHTKAVEQMIGLGFFPDFSRKNKALKKLGQSEMLAFIDRPVNCQFVFYMRTNGVADLSALYEGIQDLLVECGVLQDDNWHLIRSHDGSTAYKDADSPRIEISITEADNTKD